MPPQAIEFKKIDFVFESPDLSPYTNEFETIHNFICKSLPITPFFKKVRFDKNYQSTNGSGGQTTLKGDTVNISIKPEYSVFGGDTIGVTKGILAHEYLHFLCTKENGLNSQETTYLEEGLATYFQVLYVNDRHPQLPFSIDSDNYSLAECLIRQCAIRIPDFFTKLAELVNKMAIKDVLIDPSFAELISDQVLFEKLRKRFEYK